MYIPKSFKQENEKLLIDTISEISFGALVIFSDNCFHTSHIPFLIKKDGDVLRLEGHVSKANEIWQIAKPHNKAMVIFQGAHAYIHPGHYPTKAKTGKVVPTWNYQVVHCHGYAEKEQSEAWILKHIAELTEHHEKNQTNPWHINDAPDDFVQKLIKGIVGIRFTIERMEGALKMNQHHAEENRLGVIEGLSKCSKGHKVSKIMRELELDSSVKTGSNL